MKRKEYFKRIKIMENRYQLGTYFLGIVFLVIIVGYYLLLS
jgi:hypothetical protein